MEAPKVATIQINWVTIYLAFTSHKSQTVMDHFNLPFVHASGLSEENKADSKKKNTDTWRTWKTAHKALDLPRQSSLGPLAVSG